MDPRGFPRRWRAKAAGAKHREADERLREALWDAGDGADKSDGAESRDGAVARSREPPQLSVADAAVVAAGVVEAVAPAGSALDAVIVRPAPPRPPPVRDVGPDDPEPPHDASTHDDGWAGPSAPAVEVLGADEVASLAAEWRTRAKARDAAQ